MMYTFLSPAFVFSFIHLKNLSFENKHKKVLQHKTSSRATNLCLVDRQKEKMDLRHFFHNKSFALLSRLAACSNDKIALTDGRRATKLHY